MANYFARATGNINATNVWATTPSGTPAAQTFVAGDVLYTNSFNITVNVDTNLGSTGEVRNDNTNGATAGGSFALSSGVTLTANVFAGSFNANCVTYSGTTGSSATIVGNCTGGSTTNADAARNASSGTLIITGNLTGGSGNCSGANNNGSGTITLTGNTTGGVGTNGDAARNSGTGTFTITGNVTGGSGTGANGANNQSTGTMTITGTATGGSVSGAVGAYNNSTGTLTINGSAVGSNNAAGAQNNVTGILNVTRAVGNGWGIGTTGISSAVGVASPAAGAQTRVDELEYGSLGQAPTSGAISVPDKTSNVCLVHRLSLGKKTLVDPSANTGQAAEADVRLGVSYALGNKTGTCAVPAASSVAAGVAVGTGVGTAVLTQANVWDYALSSASSVAGSVGQKLAKAATPADIVALS